MKFRNLAKHYGSKIAIGGSTLGASFVAFADDYTALITQAQTDATGNQTGVITAVIAIAVVTFGAGALLRWLNK